jgi:2-iminoacetate synthase
LLTFEEYLQDYGDDELKAIGRELIENELLNIPNEKRRKKTIEYRGQLQNGERDLRF